MIPLWMKFGRDMLLRDKIRIRFSPCLLGIFQEKVVAVCTVHKHERHAPETMKCVRYVRGKYGEKVLYRSRSVLGRS